MAPLHRRRFYTDWFQSFRSPLQYYYFYRNRTVGIGLLHMYGIRLTIGSSDRNSDAGELPMTTGRTGST
jgi:hypothetical protein